MNRFRNLFSLVAFSLVVLALPAIASAQWRDRNDDYGRNGGNRNGNYYGNLRPTVKNLKNRSKSFEKTLDRALDNSRYDRNRREDSLNYLAERFRDAAKDLESSYGNERDYNRSRGEAQRVLDLGNQIDRAISRARLDYRVTNEWNSIRQDLNVLADAYGYNYNNRNNRNRNRNGGWSNFPFPF